MQAEELAEIGQRTFLCSYLNAAIPSAVYYIHAVAVQNMIDGKFLQRFYGIALYEIMLFFFIALFLGLLLPDNVLVQLRVDSLGV